MAKLKYLKRFNESTSEMCKIVSEEEFDNILDITDRDFGVVMSDRSIKTCIKQIGIIEEFLGSDFIKTDFKHQVFKNLIEFKSNVYDYERDGLYIRIIEVEDEWYCVFINNNDLNNIHIVCDQFEGLSKFGNIAVENMKDQYGIDAHLKKMNESNTNTTKEITQDEYLEFESNHKRVEISKNDGDTIGMICHSVYLNEMSWATNNSKLDEFVVILDRYDEDTSDTREEVISFRKFEDNWWLVEINRDSMTHLNQWWLCDDIVGLQGLKNILNLLS